MSTIAWADLGSRHSWTFERAHGPKKRCVTLRKDKFKNGLLAELDKTKSSLTCNVLVRVAVVRPEYFWPFMAFCRHTLLGRNRLRPLGISTSVSDQKMWENVLGIYCRGSVK